MPRLKRLTAISKQAGIQAWLATAECNHSSTCAISISIALSKNAFVWIYFSSQLPWVYIRWHNYYEWCLVLWSWKSYLTQVRARAKSSSVICSTSSIHFDWRLRKGKKRWSNIVFEWYYLFLVSLKKTVLCEQINLRRSLSKRIKLGLKFCQFKHWIKNGLG